LNAKVEIYIGTDFGIYTVSITAAPGSLRRLIASLLGAIATLATLTIEFVADDAAPTTQKSGDLDDGWIGFQEAVNLVSFHLAEVLVHLAT
jgi:hypothetical protein